MKEGMPNEPAHEHHEKLLEIGDRISSLDVVRLYDRDGNFIFSGTPIQMLTAWENKDLQNEELLGGITDNEGQTIVRFAPGEHEGFLPTEMIPDVFNEIARRKNESKEEHPVSVSLRESALGFDAEIVAGGESIGDASLWKAEEGTYFLHNIQIGYDADAPRNRGLGTIAYKAMIDALRAKGDILVSTRWEGMGTSISPQALRVWQKLAEQGYARVTGSTEAKVLDRFTGEQYVAIIPTYESI